MVFSIISATLVYQNAHLPRTKRSTIRVSHVQVDVKLAMDHCPTIVILAKQIPNLHITFIQNRVAIENVQRDTSCPSLITPKFRELE